MIDITTITPELLTARFEALSPQLQQEMLSEDNTRTAQAIFENYGLSAEQILLAEQLIGFVILGILPLEKLEGLMLASLSIDAMKTASIAKELLIKLPFLKNLPSMPFVSDIVPPHITPHTPNGPVVIHTETSAAPIPANIAPPDLSRNAKFQSQVESFFAKKAPAPAPQFARIQTQGSQTNTPLTQSRPQQTGEIPRVIHYGELKTMLGVTPPAPSKEPGAKLRPIPFSQISAAARPPMPAPTPTPTPAPKPMPPISSNIATPLPGVKGVPPPPRPPISPAPKPPVSNLPR